MEQENILVLTDFSEVSELSTIKSHLYSIFFNLLSNSIKYRQQDKTTIIDIRSWKENDKIMIRFKDNGRGIDLASKRNEVFDLYKRFHLDIEGKGMGLFMVKTQVRVLGGGIDVQSEPDVGTAFLIELPICFVLHTTRVHGILLDWSNLAQIISRLRFLKNYDLNVAKP